VPFFNARSDSKLQWHVVRNRLRFLPSVLSPVVHRFRCANRTANSFLRCQAHALFSLFAVRVVSLYVDIDMPEVVSDEFVTERGEGVLSVSGLAQVDA